MTEAEWHKRLGDMVREYIRSPELEHYFSIKMTKPRAAIMVTQQSLFVRHRRECWAHVSANCPVLAIKQRILEHEYEEIIRDDFSEYGHLHLIIRQGKSVGLEPEEILNAEPLPETRAVLYAWSWMTSEMSWIEALAGMTITEWCNDDRLLGDLGGGQKPTAKPTKNTAICFCLFLRNMRRVRKNSGRSKRQRILWHSTPCFVRELRWPRRRFPHDIHVRRAIGGVLCCHRRLLPQSTFGTGKCRSQSHSGV